MGQLCIYLGQRNRVIMYPCPITVFTSVLYFQLVTEIVFENALKLLNKACSVFSIALGRDKVYCSMLLANESLVTFKVYKDDKST